MNVGAVAVMDCVSVLCAPSGPVAVTVTVKFAALLNVCEGVSDVDVFEPPLDGSPKFQETELIGPPLFEIPKLTVSGIVPLVGLALIVTFGGANETVIRFAFVTVPEPPGPVAVSVTE